MRQSEYHKNILSLLFLIHNLRVWSVGFSKNHRLAVLEKTLPISIEVIFNF